ncbi:hypothetical protein GCM10010096_04440 [Alcaligenes pakistanensis]|uniref:Ancillary SecYEG translocon subunit n=1 Tax=Alcaligenes pakistanensis TaxID=1482717 RepID=A0A8H9IJL9_9BURK|nr:tetratricopeptide repeat protein [Alcaligenes pakistanensis]MBP6622295.1 tetratricopeptide repeat protein [Alcaligenes sp.]GHC37928.1 hypothetical protein GCM10010096_04440 [Alcaligenes pakistanensis]HCA18821.1 hypothetical protein [Alcaligenes faecalis]
MAYDLEEQEKLDAMRAWWDRWGTLCIVLAFVAVAAVAGWRGWQWYQGHQAAQAMGYFEALEGAAAQTGEEADTRILAASTTLRNDFAKSGYTSRGVLLAANALQKRGNLTAAREQLEWMVKTNHDPALTPLARLRLAGILLEQKNYDEALAQLTNPPASFAGLFADRKGDVLAAQGQNEAARDAWKQAVELLKQDPISQLVQIKLDALAGA